MFICLLNGILHHQLEMVFPRAHVVPTSMQFCQTFAVTMNLHKFAFKSTHNSSLRATRDFHEP